MTKKMKHSVTDINKWTSVQADIDAERKQHGVPSSSWVKDKDGKVIVTHTVTDKVKQKAFRESQKGKDHRKKATADDGEELEA
jgi:hypothetical protein